MSHELRTPLNAVMGYIQLFELESLSERQRVYIDRIRLSTLHLLGLIEEILDIAKANAGALRVENERIDLLPVVEKAVSLVAPQAQAKGLRLGIERPPGSLPPVYGDSRRISQVLLNLLSNAVKFTDTGAITVRFRCPDERAVAVIVEDTGIGIPQDKLGKLFSEFFQVDDVLSRRQGGAGLGLAISKRLAILMGGDLSAESRPGEGTTVIFTLATFAHHT